MTKQTRFSTAQLRDFYRDEYVSAYHQEDSGRLKQIIERLSISSKDSVADLACGNGLLLDTLPILPQKYVVVDFSTEFIKEAKKRYANFPNKPQFVCDEIVSFCRKHPKAYDWIFTLDFSEHIYDDQFVTIYASIAKSLKSQGRLVLHTPNADFLLERLKSRNFILKQFPEHIGIRTADQYRKLLQQSGYKNIEVQYLPHYHPLFSWLKWIQDLPVFRSFLRARLLIIAQAQSVRKD